MKTRIDLEKDVMIAARDQGISSVLFRNAIGRRLGLSITDWECLSFLTIKGISTPTELAHYTGLTSGSTTAMLDRLERAKFITRRPNPNDRRGTLVQINEKTAKTSQQLVIGIQKAHKELIASYTEKELQTITDFLTRFTNNVKNETQKLESNLTK